MGRSLDARFEADAGEIAKLLLLVGVTAAVTLSLWDRDLGAGGRVVLHTVGWIGVWRYSWWMTHLARSQIYSRRVFPRIRRAAGEVWEEGWRPRFVHFIIATYRERWEVTRRMLDAVVRECRESGAPARLHLAIGSAEDEVAIAAYLGQCSLPADVVIIQPTRPGKRYALGLALRSVRASGAHPDDLVVLMDGDSIPHEGTLRRCAPLFVLRPQLGAVTTNELVEVDGPKWIQDWYELRFTQRSLVMESHSLSGKVLTLTGRFSVYRAGIVTEESFIGGIECDSLQHWLWGTFRFLSGDDKSTWFCVLRGGHEMLYVPDAVVTTIEHVSGKGVERAIENLLRWSGNMLRNSARALALGPRKCGLFIWWCLLDQRLSAWTALVGPTAALILCAVYGPVVLAAYFVWVVLTRLCVSAVLWAYRRRLVTSFPVLLFANQVVNGVIKVYLTFRLSRQRWANRGGQQLASEQGLLSFRHAMATFVMVLYLVLLALLLSVQLGVIQA